MEGEGTLVALAGRVRWWHVCLAAGAGLSLLTLVGWASEQWGGEGARRQRHVQRISGSRRQRRGGGGGRGGGRWKKKRAGCSSKTPESKVARIKQEVKQVLSWLEKMERCVPGLPPLDKVAVPPLQATSGEEGGEKEASERPVHEGVGTVVRRACANTFEEEWDAANTASDPKRQRVERALVTFARDAARQRTAFSRSLSSFERYAVYETSERLGLTHRKVGDSIVVTKLKFELPPCGAEDGKQRGEATEEAVAGKEVDGEERSVSLERCKILEECLTMVLLDLDKLVELEDVVPRAERKSLVSTCQQLLAALDAWKVHLQEN
jgi:hypothetical protein